MENVQQYLQVVPPAQLATLNTDITVGQLEKKLLAAFPAQDACDWDRTGLSVGNPDELVEGVAVALDPTIRAFETAKNVGANVLVTHHPLYLDAPDSFMPVNVQGEHAGSRIQHAIYEHMHCMSFHTACDVSHKGLRVLPAMLHLSARYPLDKLEADTTKGFGMVCECREGLTLKQLAARCVSVFESFPRVWGNPDAKLQTVCTCGGSAGSLLEPCCNEGIDCLVCGELHYHDALDAAESGLCIIELGHDVSELPLCAVLAQEVIAAGIPESCITILNQSNNWFTPETTRR